jgi:hypothetical protein
LKSRRYTRETLFAAAGVLWLVTLAAGLVGNRLIGVSYDVLLPTLGFTSGLLAGAGVTAVSRLKYSRTVMGLSLMFAGLGLNRWLRGDEGGALVTTMWLGILVADVCASRLPRTPRMSEQPDDAGAWDED